MSRRNTTPTIGQESLFETQPVISYDPKLPDWPAVQQTKIEVAPQSEVYPSVNLAERSANLQLALQALGKASQRMGFNRALNTPFRNGIAARYGSNIDSVATGAENNIDLLEHDAGEYLKAAMGYTAIKHADLNFNLQPHQDKFLERYASPENKLARDKLKKQLKAQDKWTKAA